MPDELSFYLIPKKRTRAIEQMTPVATLKELINPRPDQEAHIADAATPTAYTPHASGTTTVTSNAATDLNTTAAALDTLIDEVTSLTTKFNTLLSELESRRILRGA